MSEFCQEKHLTRNQLQLACGNCSLAQLCLPVGLNNEEIAHLDSLVKKRKTLKKGEYLFREDQVFSKVFAVRSGSFKSEKMESEDHFRVMGFYLPGEILGFHALHEKRYAISTVALETSSVCEIPFEDLFNFASHLPTLQRHLLDLISQKLVMHFTVDPNSTAEVRLAKFLLSISARLQRRGLSMSEFILSMSRQDIANYLGLAPETISRLFSHLSEIGALLVNRREVKILQMRQLQMMACGYS